MNLFQACECQCLFVTHNTMMYDDDIHVPAIRNMCNGFHTIQYGFHNIFFAQVTLANYRPPIHIPYDAIQ